MDVPCPTGNVETPFICAVCNKNFLIKSHFNDHLYSHIQGKSVITEICRKGFSEISELNDHFRKYLLLKNSWICITCNTTFFSKADLNDHFSVHINEDPYICKTCNKVFENKTSLSAHNAAAHYKKLESPSFDYVCQFCKERFAYKGYLEKHIRICKENYVCQFCKERFAYKSYLKNHIRICCEETPYSCHICSEGFWGRPALYKHLLDFHKNIKNCV